ncbi:MAG: hypothetical protein OXK80_00670 [Bdellovibrionales bacterium]|nr:hypothetical protein [Bdellovibrionales bacterium]
MIDPLLNQLRREGFRTILTKTYRIDELFKCLEELVNLYTHISKQQNIHKEASKIIKKAFSLTLSTNSNIRGYLFNLIVKNIFDLEYKNTKINKTVEHNKQLREIDVYFEDENYRYVVECKSCVNFQNIQKEIRDWLNKKYTFFINWNKANNKNKPKKKLKIYFIISLKDSERINKIRKKFKKFDHITYYDQSFLDETAKKYQQKEIRSALKCFLNI